MNQCKRTSEVLQRSVCPRDITRLAADNLILAACLQAWEIGAVTWEYALMQATALLVEENREFSRRALLAENRVEACRIPEPVVRSDGAVFVYTGPCPVCGQRVVPKVPDSGPKSP